MHNKEKRWIISFTYICENIVISVAIWGARGGGGGSFNNQTGPILVHILLSTLYLIIIYMSNIEAI